MTEKPTPGTPEYDAAMAEKYRAQKDGPGPDSLTEDGERADSNHHIRTFNGNTIAVRKDSTAQPADPDAPLYSAAQADPAQIMMMEQEIERLRAGLAEVRGHHPRTGEPILAMSGERRRAAEIRLQQLEYDFPALKAFQQRAAQWRAENVPSAHDKLLAERERQESIRARAQAIVDERAAEAEADNLENGRRSGRLGINR